MKLDYINWYLVELRRNLIGRVTSEQEFALASQTKSHLESLTEEYISQGMDPESAQRASVERFGTPTAIARSFVEQVLSSSRPVHWAFVIVFWIILFVILLASLASGLVNSTDTMTGLIVATIALVTLATLFRGHQLGGRFWGGTMALCLAMAMLFAFPMAVIKNDRSRDTRLVNQAALTAAYDRAVRQNKVVTDFENKIIEKWDSILNDPKLKSGLAKGQTVEVPELYYSGSKAIYLSASMNPGETFHKFTSNDLLTITGSDVQIENVTYRKPEIFTGPLALSKIEGHIAENKDSIERARGWRNRAVGILSRTVSMSYFEKVAWMAGPTIFSLLVIVWPLSWITSAVALVIRRKLKAVARILRTA